MSEQQANIDAWTRNPSDTKAAANGCWFEPKRAAFVVWWIERHCRLYEGEDAGLPLHLRGCHECNPQPVEGEWYLDDGETENEEVVDACLERARQHCECVAAGHAIDWQYECTMRLFGWVRQSERWQRAIRRFRKAMIFVAKKNKKSPTLAAYGLYLTCADGEPGQKVFLGAKDGLQAKEIAGKHAIEMLNQSEELLGVCTVNMTHSQITHEPSRSILKPLSSSNSRTQQSKEGLNGSLLIDEVHVVDREFIGRISRAGISRSEPLQIEFSTAGDNPASYGKERFDHGLRILAGEVEDQSCFVALYAPPQDVSFEELYDDPLKYARMANPAMGHTVDPEELLEDYKSSLAGTVAELARCLMYRFNIWQKHGAASIKEGMWRLCADYSFDLESLAGRTCYAGLDLSKVYDTSALVLVFPPEGDDQYWRFYPYYWLPERTAEKLKDKIPVLDWHRNGHIDLTQGDWIDYQGIRAQLNTVRDTFDLVALGFDPKFSSELIQQLMEQDGWVQSEIVPFGQIDTNFAEPTAEFERLIVSSEMRHPDNPVFNWQISHLVLKENPRTKIKRAMRPEPIDHRTIDGAVAAIMGRGVAMTCEGTESIYDSPGNLSL